MMPGSQCNSKVPIRRKIILTLRFTCARPYLQTCVLSGKLITLGLALATLKRVKSLLDARFFFAAIFLAQLVAFHFDKTVFKREEIKSFVSVCVVCACVCVWGIRSVQAGGRGREKRPCKRSR